MSAVQLLRAVHPRALLLGTIGAFVLAVGWLVSQHELPRLAMLGVPTMEPRFVDARAISGASFTLSQGLDPLVINPGDPLGRPMNYPRTWLFVAWLGVGPEHTPGLVAAFLVVFGIGLLSLVPTATKRATAFLVVLGLFSPAVWLAIERGNSDLPMFGLVAVAAWLVPRCGLLASVTIVVAAALKLFPIFAVVGLCSGGMRQAARTALPVVIVFASFLWFARADLALIAAHTAHWHRIEYGFDQLPFALSTHLGWALLPLKIGAVGMLLLTLVASTAARRHRQLATALTAELAAFRMGAAIYLGTFCAGSNFDYRLMFLLLTLPQLSAWTAQARGSARPVAVALLALVVLLLWGMTWQMALRELLAGEEVAILLDESISWAVALCLLGALVLSTHDELLPRSWRGRPLLGYALAPAPAT
jgi:hypothetical protein